MYLIICGFNNFLNLILIEYYFVEEKSTNGNLYILIYVTLIKL